MGDWVRNSTLLIFALPLATYGFLALFNRRVPRHGDFLAAVGNAQRRKRGIAEGTCWLFASVE